MNTNNYTNWFLNYVNTFGNEPMIILKRDHSIRVAKDMRMIFNSLSLCNEYVSLAHFLGLYHDIGRFKQWNIYHTFNDNKSVDHADYSAYNLINEGLINQIIPERDYDMLIYNAIKYHNKLNLPCGINIKDESIFNTKLSLTENISNNFDIITSLYAMSIRDADKIDILKQYILSDDFLNTDNLPVSNSVAESFFNNKPIDKNDRKNLNDVLILRLSFINDFNLTQSLKVLQQRNLLNKIYDVFPDKENTKLFFEYANARLNQLISDNTNYQYVLKK